MDVPFLLLALLALPLVVAGLIVTVSVARRRGRSPVREAASEPAHRLQADSAATQRAAAPASVPPPPAATGRSRRAASSTTPDDR